MKKVKELKKWIELYNEVHAAAEELQLAYDYVKEGIVSEEEVDEAYGNAISWWKAGVPQYVASGSRPDELCAEDQLRCRRYGKPGLGFHVAPYVYALGGGEWI